MIVVRIRSAVWFATGAVLALVVSLLVIDSWRADAAPGDADTTFVPMTPCRLIDTRPLPERVGPAAAWGAKETKTLQGTGTNGQCTVPADAVGLSINVTALNAAQNGFLSFWPGGTRPLAASLNPSPGAPPIPNAVTVSLSATGSFSVYNENGSVDIVIDVNGYFTKSSLKELNTRLAASEAKVTAAEAKITALENAGRYAKVDADVGGATLIRGKGVASVSRIQIGEYKVEFSAPIDQCGWFANLNDNGPGGAFAGETSIEQDSAGDPNSLRIRTHDSTGTPVDPSDSDGFSVHVVC